MTFVITTAMGCGIVYWTLKKFVDKITEQSLKKYQGKIDEELEKLKSANARVNHIMFSLKGLARCLINQK